MCQCVCAPHVPQKWKCLLVASEAELIGFYHHYMAVLILLQLGDVDFRERNNN